MVATKTVLSGIPNMRRQSEHRFFAWLAVSAVVLVFVGFSGAYYLHSLFKTPSLSTFPRVHGAVINNWIVLFAVQTLLIASDRRRAHTVLGASGSGCAVLVVIMGCTATVFAARREALANLQFVSGVLTVLALELTQMFLIPCLVTSGIWLSNQAGWHKRLMLLATFSMFPNPIARLFIWAGFGTNIVILSLWTGLVAAVVLLDSQRRGRLHPAFGIGATITIATLYLAYVRSLTSRWQRFAAEAEAAGGATNGAPMKFTTFLPALMLARAHYGTDPVRHHTDSPHVGRRRERTRLR